MAIKISLLNCVDGELDCRVVETEEEARDAAIEIIAGVANLNIGDRLIIVDTAES